MSKDTPPMGDAPRLKPCPFCGGTDIECEELGYNALGHHICRDCDASGPTSEKTVANSAKAWNRRAQSEGQAKVEWPATLPCDVLLAPGTILRKGVSLSALMAALRIREKEYGIESLEDYGWNRRRGNVA